MKLLTKTTLLIVTISIVIIYAGNLLFFQVTKQMVEQQVDSELKARMNKMKTVLEKAPSHAQYFSFSSQIDIQDSATLAGETLRYSDTVLYKQAQDKYVPHRALTFTQKINNQARQITIFKSLLASDKLLRRVATTSIILVALFGLLIYVMNRYVFEQVWSPFFRNLQKIEQYDIKNDEKLSLESSEIQEFEKLNRVHSKMVERLHDDFVNLKELTAKTSHELQTPLAVIKGKAELLMQSDRLGREEFDTVNTILNTTKRLSRLNQSLLLIFKIENNQYDEVAEIDVKEVLERFIENYRIMLEGGQYQLETSIAPCRVYMNPVLADMLLANLLKNAIMHGEAGGRIKVGVTGGSLLIANAGKPLPISEKDLFKRFTRRSGDNKGTGLGLEIVRKICAFYNLPLMYNYVNGMHRFTIDFQSIATGV